MHKNFCWGGFGWLPIIFVFFPIFLGFNQETKGIQPTIMGVEWDITWYNNGIYDQRFDALSENGGMDPPTGPG